MKWMLPNVFSQLLLVPFLILCLFSLFARVLMWNVACCRLPACSVTRYAPVFSSTETDVSLSSTQSNLCRDLTSAHIQVAATHVKFQCILITDNRVEFIEWLQKTPAIVWCPLLWPQTTLFWWQVLPQHMRCPSIQWSGQKSGRELSWSQWHDASGHDGRNATRKFNLNYCFNTVMPTTPSENCILITWKRTSHDSLSILWIHLTQNYPDDHLQPYIDWMWLLWMTIINTKVFPDHRLPVVLSLAHRVAHIKTCFWKHV